MAIREFAYESVMRMARPLSRMAAPFNQKLRAGLEGRALALEQLDDWARTERDPTRALVWVHAPSVGEALMARVIVAALRESVPDLQIAFTHFSPSAERMRDQVGADVSCYLAWDTSDAMQDLLDLLDPAVIAFVRSEIWPTLVRLADQRDIPVALVNAVLAEKSSRLRPLARFALRPAYARLHAVGTVDDLAAERFERLGVLPDFTRVTGDARFDQVWEHVQALQRGKPLLQRLSDVSVTTIVAGSTWPADHEHLLPAFQAVDGTRLILAPHEPTEEVLSSLEDRVAQLELTCARLKEIEAATHELPDVVLVDRFGVLADLYAVADIAYVGGAFHAAGVHSVVEPAAHGVPVLIGPRHANAVEAEELVDIGAAVVVHNSEDITSAFDRLISDGLYRRGMGIAARAFVRSKLGGARANAQLIAELLAYTDQPFDD